MLEPYRDVLRVPGAVAWTSAGLVARLPISMQGLGVVLLVEGTTGSYALAGVLSATFALAQALLGPLLGRLVDRHGQARVLLPALALYVLGLGGLVALAVTDAPTWTLFPAAALYGASYPQPGSLVRARWAHVLGGTPRLATAFSMESVLDEVVFVVGPVLVTVLATTLFPAAGVLAAAVFTLVGSVALAVQRGTEPPPHPRTGERRPTVLRSAGLRMLVLVAVACGGIFGSVEVATVAFADERGRPASAGVVLALLAAGSLLSGLWYGTVNWRAPLHRRFVLGVVLLAAVLLPLPLADNVPTLAALVFAAGFMISPTLIAAFALLETLVPAEARTEGLTWFSTGLGLGLAVGASLTGQIVDESSGRAALGVTVAAGVLAAVLALAGARLLTPAEPA